MDCRDIPLADFHTGRGNNNANLGSGLVYQGLHKFHQQKWERDIITYSTTKKNGRHSHISRWAGRNDITAFPGRYVTQLLCYVWVLVSLR